MLFFPFVCGVLLALRGSSVRAFIHWNDNDETGSCPVPRVHTPVLSYPCGSDGSISESTSRLLEPGWQTLRWTEQVEKLHGSVFRIALSLDGEDSYDGCVLLDNIPHNDMTPSDTVDYAISVNVPDVDCQSCALQISQIGTPETGSCLFEQECPTSDANCTLCVPTYFSCANVKINGQNLRNDFTCPPPPGEGDDWPYGATTDKSYTRLATASTWEDGMLVFDGDSEFSTPAGACATLEHDKDTGPTGIGAGTAVAITFGVLFIVVIMCAFIYVYIRRRNATSSADVGLLATDGRSSQPYEAASLDSGPLGDNEEQDDDRPLPPGWEEFFADDGNPYYYCEATGQTQWERP